MKKHQQGDIYVFVYKKHLPILIQYKLWQSDPLNADYFPNADIFIYTDTQSKYKKICIDLSLFLLRITQLFQFGIYMYKDWRVLPYYVLPTLGGEGDI